MLSAEQAVQLWNRDFGICGDGVRFGGRSVSRQQLATCVWSLHRACRTIELIFRPDACSLHS